MKRILTTLITGMLFVILSACAHNDVGSKKSESESDGMHGSHGKHKAKNPAARAAKLKEKLGLTNEQTRQVEAVLADSANRKVKHEGLKGILTQEQFAQYEEMKANRGQRGRHGKHRKGGSKDPGARAAKLKATLGLTDEQTTKVEAVFADSASRDEKRDALKGILTPEQLAQYEEMKARRGERRGFKAPKKRAAWMQSELGLTDEQTAQVEAVFADSTSREEKHDALKGVLGPEGFAQYEEMMANRGRWRGKHGKRGYKAPEKRATWMQAELGLTDEQTANLVAAFKESKNREEKHEAVKRILTPEQLTQYEEMLAKRKSRRGKHGK